MEGESREDCATAASRMDVEPYMEVESKMHIEAEAGNGREGKSQGGWPADAKPGDTKKNADSEKSEPSDVCLQTPSVAGVKQESTDQKHLNALGNWKVQDECDTNLRQETESDQEGFKKDEKQREQRPRKEDDGAGYIYVMRDKPDRFKVGCSNKPESRLRHFQTGNVDLRLVHKEYVSDHMKGREKHVHADILRKYRYRNPEIKVREWYIGCTLDYLLGIIKRHASGDYQD